MELKVFSSLYLSSISSQWISFISTLIYFLLYPISSRLTDALFQELFGSNNLDLNTCTPQRNTTMQDQYKLLLDTLLRIDHWHHINLAIHLDYHMRYIIAELTLSNVVYVITSGARSWWPSFCDLSCKILILVCV